jgi:hypothetical protein
MNEKASNEKQVSNKKNAILSDFFALRSIAKKLTNYQTEKDLNICKEKKIFNSKRILKFFITDLKMKF